MILDKLKEEIKGLGIDGFLYYRTNKFLSEEMHESDERLAFVTGFRGSFGFLAVLKNKAALFIDSRYMEQAKKEVRMAGLEVLEFPENTPTGWIKDNAPPHAVIGIDPYLCPISLYENIKEALEGKDITLKGTDNIIDALWKDRPAEPDGDIYEYDIKYAGLSHIDKLRLVQDEIIKAGAEHLVISTLDDIAWLFNLRGSDIPYTPLFYAYAIVSRNDAALYVKKNIKVIGINVKGFDSFYNDLDRLGKDKVMLDTHNITQGMASHVRNPLKTKSPCTRLKSVKNDIEIRGARIAVGLNEGIVFSRLFEWLSRKEKSKITEMDVIRKIERLRQEIKSYQGPSFPTICGVDRHAGIPHYHNTEASDVVLSGKILLIDSGGQYLEGTTDMTRTISLDSKPTSKQKHDYTLVLKGHIKLSRMKFPKGITGGQLDSIARQFLWQEGKDYRHGTGHGVGSYLCVHETPPSFSIKVGRSGGEEAFLPGMITSNEPGYYNDEYGIRIENMMLAKEDNDGIMAFDTLTLIPYDRRMIDKDMLDRSEKEWIDGYHVNVYEHLKSRLEKHVKRWLKEACRKL